MIEPAEVQDLFGDPVQIGCRIDREALTRALVHSLRDKSLEDFVALLTNDYSEIIEYAELCSGESACHQTSLLFNPHRLDTWAGVLTKPRGSIYGGLKDDGFCSGLARATLWKHGKVGDLLRQVIQTGINAYQYVNEFPPRVARDLALQYNLSRQSAVVDPLAGVAA